MRWRQGVMVAGCYCGAVVGAGFATGREVVEFFTVYGRAGLAGIVLATALFCWLGITILDITHRHSIYSYFDLLAHILVRPYLVRFADILLQLTLLVCVGVMTAAGATIAAGWGLGYGWGCCCFLVVCLLMLRTGTAGYMRANAVLVPFLVAMVLMLCMMEIALPAGSTLKPGPLPAGVLYVGYNLAMAGVALSTLKDYLDRPSVVCGGVGGGLVLGLLLMVIFLATLSKQDFSEIPMADLARTWLRQHNWLYHVSLLAAVLTTALASIHGLAARIGKGHWYWPTAVIICGMGLAISLWGFSTLVSSLYPLLGACNIVLLAGLCYYSCTRGKS